MSEASKSCSIELPTEHARALIVSLTDTLNQQGDPESFAFEVERHKEIINVLLMLLNSKDHHILKNALELLLKLSKKTSLCKIISQLNSVEILMTIIDVYDVFYKRLASELLAELLDEEEPKQMVKICEGVQILLRVLNDCDIATSLGIVQCLCKVSRDQELASEIKSIKGLETLLSLLHDKKYHPTNQNVCSPLVSGKEDRDEEVTVEKSWIQLLTLKSTFCNCLAELVCYDIVSLDIIQTNAIFLVSLLILPPSCHQSYRCPSGSSQSEISYHEAIQSWSSSSMECEPIGEVDFDNSGLGDTPLDDKNVASSYRKMQACALKAMRFIFSMERNRCKFKKLFNPRLFERFIDIGHYNREKEPYEAMAEEINKLDQESLQQMKINIRRTNINRTPSKVISDYAVVDLLGSGAFGTVYKVHKVNQPQMFFAMKEVHETSCSLASSDGLDAMKQLHTELNILQENLCHQNIVQYLPCLHSLFPTRFS